MFNGDYKSKRRVNMGGKWKQEEKKDFIVRARVEREERAIERRRARACLLIQSVWRRYQSIKKDKRSTSSELNQKLHDLIKLEEILLLSGQEFNLPSSTLLLLLRQFVYTYNEINHNKHFAKLCKLFQKNISYFKIEDSILADGFLEEDSAEKLGWITLMSKYLSICLLDVINSTRAETPQFLISLLKTLSLEIPGHSPSRELSAVEKLWVNLCIKERTGVLEVLLNILQGSPMDTELESILVSVLHRVTDICSRASKSVAIQFFTRISKKFLVICGVFDNSKLIELFLHILKSDGSIDMFIESLHNISSKTNSRDTLGAIIAGNLIDLTKHIQHASFTNRVGYIISLYLSCDLLRAVFRADKGTIMDIDEDESKTGISNVEWTIEAHGSRQLREIEKAMILEESLQNKLRNQITQLFDEVLLNILLVKPLLVSASGSLSTYLNSSINGLVQVYASIVLYDGDNLSLQSMQTYSDHASRIINLLCFLRPKHGVLYLLWKYFEKNFREPSLSSLDKTAKSILYLIFSGYSYALITLDDEAFYDRLEMMPLEELRIFINCIKRYLYLAYWKDFSLINSNSCTLSDIALMISSTRLFNQLYDRQCRRTIFSPEAWNWPLISSQEIDNSSLELDPLSPLSQVLLYIPQVLPFHQRLTMLQRFLEEDKAKAIHIRNVFSSFSRAQVRRENIVEDSYEMFRSSVNNSGPESLKSRMQITFVNEQGLNEAGVDGGGLFKEFMDTITKEAFDPQYGFFSLTETQLLYPNPSSSLVSDDYMSRFKFLSQLLGKAIYEEILVEPQFANFFLNKLLRKHNHINDLHSMDPEFYRHLMYLKSYDGNVESLCLTFSVNQKMFGKNETYDLCHNGRNIVVTKENRIKYLHLLAHYKLNIESSAQTAAFLSGFNDLIPTRWIRMLSTEELQMLISGSALSFDISDWKKHTVYSGGYHISQPIIQWFWETVDDMNSQNRAELLKFITSCSRPPLQGFGRLNPLICIQQVRINEDDRLPTSSTCMNLLKLPTYSSKEILKEKLLYAITSKAGFELS